MSNAWTYVEQDDGRKRGVETQNSKKGFETNENALQRGGSFRGFGLDSPSVFKASLSSERSKSDKQKSLTSSWGSLPVTGIDSRIQAIV